MSALPLLFVALMIAANPVLAGTDAAIRKALTAAIPSAKIDSIRPSAVAGVKEVTLDGKIIYVSDDGRHLFQGHLVELGTRKDLTEVKLAGLRKAALEKLGSDRTIVFKPKIGRYVVWVFTDVECGYCRKLHGEIDQYLAQGVEIRYLFYPRAGKESESYAKSVSVWCADDRNAALTQAKRGQDVPKKTCANPVDEHMALGERFGMQGTPLIVTQEGVALPGYVPAAELVKLLAKGAS
ncbi:DsbC family protein [Methylotetracoccus oryzae]|uniref:DsbC family protein n=1 Tax=Methylotetracoccus oryzae TaxID=1919059 RepID=UPI00111A55CF|nr:DsbC family protein [Methylotetracoccus oryzae]